MERKPRHFKKKRPARNTSFKPKALNRDKTKITSSLEDLGDDIRLNKYVAHCGICSRRKAGEYILEGHVKVNGMVIKEPGHRINPKDEVRFKGEIIRPEAQKVYILLNKPKDTITTARDERGRKTVFDLIGDDVKQRVFPVGRLDRDTTGLLMLTNDGDLNQKLAHPKHKVKKIYHALLDKPLIKNDLKKIAEGLDLEDGSVAVNWVNYTDEKDRRAVGVEIHIGRNRIVRRIFEHLGYQVKKLDRIYFGGLTKKDLPRGRYRFLTEKEIIMLRHFT